MSERGKKRGTTAVAVSMLMAKYMTRVSRYVMRETVGGAYVRASCIMGVDSDCSNQNVEC